MNDKKNTYKPYPEKEACRYNKFVRCADKSGCWRNCGWNPSVAHLRSMRIRNAMNVGRAVK